MQGFLFVLNIIYNIYIIYSKRTALNNSFIIPAVHLGAVYNKTTSASGLSATC